VSSFVPRKVFFLENVLFSVTGGSAVLFSAWNYELAKELVKPPPGDSGADLIYFLRNGQVS